ncbi:MAG: HAD-IA family hydrolase [Erysipelotrichales bacterium]|nr:HAD-IA family hydrolase [Erysipelotrichales bacterium]
MEDLIKRMEKYAVDFNIPIMQAEGMEFVLDFVNKHQIKRILEIGAAIGYSSIRMCMLDDEIHVTTIERDPTRYNEAVKNIKEAGFENRITLIHGDALEYEITGEYDFIFIDAAKAQYTKFFERFVPNLNKNGYIISDNLSFHGLVDPNANVESRNVRQLVRKIRNYISYLEENETFKTTFYELGDGIAVTEYKNKSFDGFIFDMDGLIIDSESVSQKNWQKVALRHGFELPVEITNKFLGRSAKDVQKIFETEANTDIDFWTIKNEVVNENLKQFEKEGVKLMPGVRDLLEYLKSKNKRMVVATSTYHDLAIDRLKMAGIYAYFDAVVTGDMVKNSKPDPEIFLLAREKIGVSKLNSVVLEDSNSGIEAAHNAGIRSIMVPGIVSPSDESKRNSFIIVDTLIDFKKYLEENE